MAVGVIKKAIGSGFTPLLDGEVNRLRFGVLNLAAGESHTFSCEDREYSIVLIQGEARVEGAHESAVIGPRMDPFSEKPEGCIFTCGQSVTVTAIRDSFLGVGSAKAEQTMKDCVVHMDDAFAAVRGDGNWKREVRFCVWNDNTVGNQMMMGETVIPAGNWSTFPPHRHSGKLPGETAYDEAFFMLFRQENGFGMVWQYEDEENLDQVSHFETGSLIYGDKGFHTLVVAPVCDCYQLTVMAGPSRKSSASVDERFKIVLDQSGMVNPYQNQKSK